MSQSRLDPRGEPVVTSRAAEVSASAKDPSGFPVGTTAVVAVGALQAKNARNLSRTVPDLDGIGFHLKPVCDNPGCKVHSHDAQLRRGLKQLSRTVATLNATLRVLHDDLADQGVDVTTVLWETFNPAGECGFPGSEDWTPLTWYAFAIGLDPDTTEHRWVQVATGSTESLRSTLTATSSEIAAAVTQVVDAANGLLDPAPEPAPPTAEDRITALEGLVITLREQLEVQREEFTAAGERLAVATAELEVARRSVTAVEGRNRTLTNEVSMLMRLNRDLQRDLDAAVARAQAAEQARPGAAVVAEAVTAHDEREAPAQPELPDGVTTVAGALLAGRDAFAGLLITDHAIDQARRLDHDAKAGVWARRTWNALVDLDDFARTPVGEAWSLHRYLTTHPAARTSAIHVAEGESDTVVDSHLAKLREFPVPPEVAPTGFAQVFAHVRIESGGKPPAPRLYYLDDRARTGRVVVAYAGPHLPSARRA